MKKLFVITVIVTVITLSSSFSGVKNPFGIIQKSINDSLAKDRAKHIALIKEMIKGKEKLQADSVFKNIEILREMPAERLLAVMDIAYSRSLGVSCGHCHNTSSFDSDEKHTKVIAKDMIKMTRQIRMYLKTVNGLPEGATINCTTCHRGQIVPALDF